MSELQSSLQAMLRSCVQCGLCLPHCATYLGTGNEVQSPRGRLMLLDDLLNTDGGAIPDSYLVAFDQCIGCRACETVCPSGVPFTVLEYGHDLVAEQSNGVPAAGAEPGVPEAVLRRLDSPGFLRKMGKLGAVTRSLLRMSVGSDWRQKMDNGPAPAQKLARLLGSLPTSPATDADLVRILDDLLGQTASKREWIPGAGDALAGEKQQLLFFSGCANAGLLPATSGRLIQVLAAAGFDVVVQPGQDCCGALAAHTGNRERATLLKKRNLAAFSAAPGPEQAPVVVEAAGCGLELKAYGPEFAARVTDPISLLAGSPHPALRPVPLKVVFHDPCHARHGLKVTEGPRALLDAIPELEWCEPSEKEVCCGSGGAWGLRYPQLSADLARRKAADLAATGADLVVTTNPGCLGQIADGLALEAPQLPILPLTDLWWFATGPPDYSGT